MIHFHERVVFLCAMHGCALGVLEHLLQQNKYSMLIKTNDAFSLISGQVRQGEAKIIHICSVMAYNNTGKPNITETVVKRYYFSK